MPPEVEGESFESALDRARRLYAADRIADARALYLQLLEREPDHPRALADFGTLLFKTGYRAAARTVYERALALAPGSARAHLNLANVFFAQNEYEDARRAYEAALQCEPELAEAHQGLSLALTRLGREDEARVHRRRGYGGRALVRGEYRGSAAPIEVLLLTAALGGTLYTDEILDDRIFRTTTLVADVADVSEPLPPVDVAFNAVADADRAPQVLAALAARFEGTALPIVNPPARVLATTRAANAARLSALAGVVAPRITAFARADLPAALRHEGFGYPLLLRAPGYHTGEHFVRVERESDVGAAVAALPGDEVLAIEYVDLRARDGAVRKYRVLFVDGVRYPLHVAIAHHWKVHYATAEMTVEPSYRAEERRFLEDPAAVLGAEGEAALARIGALIGLDYFGVDFGLDRAGRIVVFEANATMIVLPPGPEPIWDYRRPHVARIIAAAQTMLRARAVKIP